MNKTWKSIKRNWFLYLLLVVPITYAVVFKYLPMIGLQIAFKNYRVVDGIFRSPWAGAKYFEMFFNSPNFWPVLKNTIILSVYNLALSFPIAIIFAIMVNEVR